MSKVKGLASIFMVFFVAFYLYSCGGGGSSSSTPSGGNTHIIHGGNGGNGTGGGNGSGSGSGSGNSSNNGTSSSKFTVQPGNCNINNFQWAGTITGKDVKIDGRVYYSVPEDAIYEIDTEFDNTTYKTSYLTKRITISDTGSDIQPITWLNEKLNNINDSVDFGYGDFFQNCALVNKHFYFFRYDIADSSSDSPVTVMYNANLATESVDNSSLIGYKIGSYNDLQFTTQSTGSLGSDYDNKKLLISMFSTLGNYDASGELAYGETNTVYGINTNDNSVIKTPLYSIGGPVTHYLQPFTEANGYLYSSGIDSNGNSVFNIIDEKNDELVKSVGLNFFLNSDNSSTKNYLFFSYGRAVASYDGNYVYVPVLVMSDKEYYSFLLKVDTATNTLSAIGVYAINGWYIADIAVSPDGKYVYVMNSIEPNPGYMEMTVINTQTLTQKAFKVEIPYSNKQMYLMYQTFYITSGMGMGLEISKDGKYLYAPILLESGQNGDSDNYVIKFNTDTLINSVQ